MLSEKVKIRVQDLTVSYGPVLALDHITFDVMDGEFLAILGPSGCGKTTILRTLIGLIQPDEGSVVMDGNDISVLRPADRRMGIVFQNYALFENMTILQNVAYGLKYKPEYKQTATDIARELLQKVGLGGMENKKPGALSGGQQQRVAIARTLAVRPDVILFDEPMSALDVSTRLELRRQILALQKEFGTTMIYITHDQEEAFSMADRIMVMNKGEVLRIDTPENIVAEPGDEFVRSFVIDNLQTKVNSLTKYIKAVVTE